MSRGKLAAWALYALVFLIGALTLIQQAGTYVAHIVDSHVSHVQNYNNSNSSTGTGGADSTANVSSANFDYLLPSSNSAWTVATSQIAYDPAHAIVKYDVTFTNAKVVATITQQVFPQQLSPRTGANFTAFINNSKPTRSLDENGGTLYFLPALRNGVLASDGTDTVIFARDDVLMFGQAQSILGWAAWTQIMGSMQKHA